MCGRSTDQPKYEAHEHAIAEHEAHEHAIADCGRAVLERHLPVQGSHVAADADWHVRTSDNSYHIAVSHAADLISVNSHIWR